MRHAHDEPVRFLRMSYDMEDRVAVFLKSSATCGTKQRIVLVRRVLGSEFLGWLHARNLGTWRWNVYISVNTIARHRRTRRRDDVAAVRHIFLDVDANADAVVATIEQRSDIPLPSYVMRSSPGRLHLLWRIRGAEKDDVEGLQRQLARELGADLAATASCQLTRLPGFLNHKYRPPYRVSIIYRASDRVFTRGDFPAVRQVANVPVDIQPKAPSSAATLERARRYLSHIDPAISGQHGNQRTFQVACRLVRGFALTDVDALALMTTWNSSCEPPWTDQELVQMLRNARRYGRGPIGGLLGSALGRQRPCSAPPPFLLPHRSHATGGGFQSTVRDISGDVSNVSNLADRRSFEVPENAMPRQQNRAVEQSHPSQRAHAVPYRAIKFTKSPSAGGRLAFADVIINEDTFHLFNGLKVCSFVILKPKGYGQPRRVYVPGHKLPSGQNFRHVQQDSRDLDELQQAILTAYEERYGNADTANADAHSEESLDEERVDEAEMPF